MTSLYQLLEVVDGNPVKWLVKSGEIWQSNFWIWILQVEEHYV